MTQRVFYTVERRQSARAQLYSVKLDGAEKRRLDKRPGTHHISMGPGGTYYLDTYSS